MTRKLLLNKLIVIAFVLACLMLGISCDSKQNTQILGQEVKLSSLIGTKPIILDFWASWCQPCRELMPKLQAYYQANQDKVIVVGISVDNSPEAAQSFVAKNKITFTILYDGDKSISQQYQISGIPTTVVINTSGEIVNQGHFGIDELKRIVDSSSVLGSLHKAPDFTLKEITK